MLDCISTFCTFMLIIYETSDIRITLKTNIERINANNMQISIFPPCRIKKFANRSTEVKRGLNNQKYVLVIFDNERVKNFNWWSLL